MIHTIYYILYTVYYVLCTMYYVLYYTILYYTILYDTTLYSVGMALSLKQDPEGTKRATSVNVQLPCLQKDRVRARFRET